MMRTNADNWEVQGFFHTVSGDDDADLLNMRLRSWDHLMNSNGALGTEFSADSDPAETTDWLDSLESEKGSFGFIPSVYLGQFVSWPFIVRVPRHCTPRLYSGRPRKA